MSSAQSLQKLLQKGGSIDASAGSQDDVIQAATDAGLTAIVVDCDRARSRSAVLRAVVKAVDFPEFFGSNLDALYDCLSDTVMDQRNGLFLWFYKLHTGDPILADDAKAILDICADVVGFAENNERVFSYVVEHAGKHPDPVLEEPARGGGDDE